MLCDLNMVVVRQVLILLASCFTTFTVGIIAAFPSVLNPALLAPDGEIRATSVEASWIYACFGISAVPALAVIPLIFNIFGRKTTNILTSVTCLIGCIVQCVSKDIYSLAFSRICQGISLPGLDIFSYGLSECVSPKRRAYFIVLNKISLALGALACHGLGFIMNWRQIALLSAIPVFLSAIISIIIKESPSFFAYQGHFDKCANAFEWYRGDSLKAKEELKQLVEAQKENFKNKRKEKNIGVLNKIKTILASKDFRTSLIIVTLAKLSLDLCGRQFIISYITQMLIEITKNEPLSMTLSATADILMISGLCISCILVKHFSRRALLFNLGFCSVFLMLIVGLSLVLGHELNLMHHMKWFSPTIMLLHMFVTHLGLAPLAFALSSEVFSLEHRGIGLFLSGTVSMGCYSLLMKIIPTMIDTVGVEGVYSIFGFCLLVCLILLRIILIETKDKTLQQIEDELRGIERKNSETELLNCSNVTNG